MAIISALSSNISMPKQVVKPNREVIITKELGHARVLTLNRPNHLNFLGEREVLMLGQKFEKYEKDDEAEFVIIKGAGRTFSAGGDLKTFYDRRNIRDSCLEGTYRMYWLCYHIHTYKKPHIALVHGMAVGGGASLMVPMKFSVVTEKAKLFQLEKRLVSINSGEEDAIRSVINEFSTNIDIDERSILKKLSIINECFSKDSVEEIVESLEAEASKKGNDWIITTLKNLKKASPTGLKITLRSIREGRTQTLFECLRREFRITMNILRTVISGDLYEGIRAAIIDKDKSPKWNPSTLNNVHDDQLDLIFKPFEEDDLELQIPEDDECRWEGNYENSGYCRPSTALGSVLV
uniref:3-hydroxyisobutyryl-CoA hydrolase n=1 Tax=Nicotiana sylvestris TaxID=4096 RepID=A0A1U7V7P8_NICSY|nr:PREDICTED: 3-hydroxyisobutyryl-CoA hydrolase-like protein 5 isoform X3 [Nicotiana sylvestris]